MSTFDSGFLESPQRQWLLIPVKKLYIRLCYKTNLEMLKKKRNQSNSGQILKFAFIGTTSGIDKSGFLQFLLIYLVHDAKVHGVVYSIRLKVRDVHKKIGLHVQMDIGQNTIKRKWINFYQIVVIFLILKFLMLV